MCKNASVRGSSVIDAGWSPQAEECLKRENERAEHYLHPTSEPKLLEVWSILLFQAKTFSYVSDVPAQGRLILADCRQAS